LRGFRIEKGTQMGKKGQNRKRDLSYVFLKVQLICCGETLTSSRAANMSKWLKKESLIWEIFGHFSEGMGIGFIFLKQITKW
jgi:hypothetical protein